MNLLKAVLWDMDGTLIDSEHVAVEAFRLAMIDAGLPEIPDLYDRVLGRAADDLYRWLVADFGLALPAIEWEERKHFHHFNASEQIKGFTAATDVFCSLDYANIPQAVVSNSDRKIVDVQLTLAGLTRPGHITVSRNDVRKGKPDPEGYLRAAWLLGVKPSECLVVEDSNSGAAAGTAARMATVMVPHATVAAPAGVLQLTRMEQILNAVQGSGLFVRAIEEDCRA